MARSKVKDNWDSIADLDGLAHYKSLGIDKSANAEAIKKAYRECARKHHPDKGGDPQVFAGVQAAFETLSNPQKRAVYDDWAKEVQFRYVPGVTPKAEGGEDVLLDEFEGLGLHCEPRTQLVVLCEVCRRPSTKECWTCGMKICDFCTLKRHWKDTWQLHWPLINSDHMRYKLAQRELEQKRIEDGNRLLLKDPNSRSVGELKVIRAFKTAAQKMLAREGRQVAYSLELAQFYMWAQTPYAVILAIFIPTGYHDKQLDIDCTETTLRVQPQNSLPVIDRFLSGRVDCSRPVETYRTEDNRVLGLVMAKSGLGEHWQRLFRGDPDGARCMQPPYTLSESTTDATLEISVPFWIDAEDICIDICGNALHVAVRNELELRRTCWQNWSDRERLGEWQAIDPTESAWCLHDSDADEGGEPVKSLVITLARPPPTESEVMWKRGVRQDNRVAERAGSMQKRGYRFFADDEDEHGLEDLLQALCFLESGSTWVPAKPWEEGSMGVHITELHLLPSPVQKLLQNLTRSENGEAENGVDCE